MPTIADLMRALPEDRGAEETLEGVSAPLAAVSLRPVPVGRLRRLGLLGTLQAKVAAAYLFYWVRGWFQNAGERERSLAEAHWKTALRVLDSMGYLRGAAMKIGQTLANFPDIVPAEFVETLDELHYSAPPMHWALLREMVENELGDDPENLFASFSKRAFAAASLGQVHAGRLRSGEEVAVKIQYPGIARTIGEDFRNLALFLLPGRLDKDWEHVKNQMDDLRMRLERETDYQAEAAMLAKARSVFREEDGILIPKVYPELSTARVLTMERIEGVHLDEFLRGNPSQEERNEAGRKVLRAWYRLFMTGRVVYADFHPGNFLFRKDGRLGVIDFGFVLPLEGELWNIFGRMDRLFRTGRREDRIAAVKEWSWITDDPIDAERLRLSEEYADWVWRSIYGGGDFYFGDEANFKRGVDLFTEIARKRYSRSRPCTPTLSRQQFGIASILYRLKARVDVRSISEKELKATDWGSPERH
ncbi:MAG TPA: AarF/ABC1/UbiB kinase family protein [Candidatus Limnocylindrales bacterium]|nr:AarF/ABC1/UbiB kinase family protein [Candidatus Limnocylindrales bacterium]